MRRFSALLYGVISYAIFLATICYAIGFVAGLPVPKSIDTGPVVPLEEALTVNLLLLVLFAIQHSGMARAQFKAWLTRYMPKEVERSTFVLLSSLALVLLFWQWRPMPVLIWNVENPLAAGVLTAIALGGWLLVLSSTFLINHLELFGVQQVLDYLHGRPAPQPRFRTPLFYRLVRHPIYLGFVIAFWVTPAMSVGHLLFAVVTTGYILVGIALEERDLVELFGDDYRSYRSRVSMLIPGLGVHKEPTDASPRGARHSSLSRDQRS